MKKSSKIKCLLKAGIVIVVVLALIMPGSGSIGIQIFGKHLNIDSNRLHSESLDDADKIQSLDVKKSDSRPLISSKFNNKNEIVVSFKMQDLIQTQINTDDGAFTLLGIPSAGFTGEIGKPQLPCVTRLIAVPNSQVSLEIIETNVMESRNVGRVYPVQEPQPDFVYSEPEVFAFDEVFYTSDVNYPGDIVRNIYQGKVRDIPFVRIGFYPVQYNAKTEIATIYDDITIKITFEETVLSVENDFEQSPFYSFYGSVFTNWDEFIENVEFTESSSGDSRSDPGCEYLIITHPDFLDAANDLANWKNTDGINTMVVDTDETGSTVSDIGDYIQTAYDTWDPRPSYLLLLGDAEFIPTNYVNIHPYHGTYTGTDLWYVTVDDFDGDPEHYPDIFYGRIPVDTLDQADVVVQKIIGYEQNPPDHSGFNNNVTFAAYFQDDDDDGMEDRRFVRTSEEIRDYLLAQGYNAERIYCTNSINPDGPTHYSDNSYAWPHPPGEPLPDELLIENGFAWDGDSSDITDAINHGTFLVNHRDHGASRNYGYLYDGWGDPHYDTTDIETLTNGEKLPVVFSMNCMTGWFDEATDDYPDFSYESFCEAFLRKSDGGAVGAVGATRVSYSGHNDFMCRGFYDAIWPDFDFNFGDDTQFLRMGEVLYYGKCYMAEYGEGGYPFGDWDLEWEIFHWFGDPTMEMGIDFSPPPAPVWYVDDTATGANNGTSWTDAFTDLQLAIENATYGNQIWVATGEYTPVPRDDGPYVQDSPEREISFQMKEGVAMYGGFAGNEEILDERAGLFEQTVLSGDLNDNDAVFWPDWKPYQDNYGENSYHVVSAISVDNAVLDGFNITAGYNNGWDPIDKRGGGINILEGSPTISNCTLIYNKGQFGYGASICCWDTSAKIDNCTIIRNIWGTAAIYINGSEIGDLQIIGCKISENMKSDGIFLNTASGNSADLSIIDCIISNNEYDGIGSWYAYCYDGPPNPVVPTCPTISITNCTISNNTYGSGISMSSPRGVTDPAFDLNIANCTISNNKGLSSDACGNGGGIYLNSHYFMTTISNCIIIGNTLSPNYAGGSGAGIYCWGTNTEIKNCMITGNQVIPDHSYNSMGGGIYCFRSNIWINGCTITGNNATNEDNNEGRGGGIYCKESLMYINNSIIWNNTASQFGNQIYLEEGTYGDPAIINVAYSEVEGGQAEVDYYGAHTINWLNNIDDDPLFVGGLAGQWTDGAVYDSEADQTMFIDNNAGWTDNELVGKFLNSDTTQHLQALIVGNTANEIRVLSYFAELGTTGATYQINDYHLTGVSPCIDTGNPDYVQEPAETDIDGEQRVIDADGSDEPIIDMGADEYQPVTIVSARSIRNHGDTEFALEMIVDPNINVEPRLGGVQNITINLSGPVDINQVSVSVENSTDSSFTDITITQVDADTINITFNSALPDQNCYTITLSGDTEDSFQVRTLEGDANRDGSVSTADCSSVKQRLEESVTTSNCQYDVNHDGSISSADASSIKQRLDRVCLCPS